MKLGPIRVMKERSFRALVQSQPAPAYQVHTFRHYPVNVRVAPPVILEPDTPTAEARQAAALFTSW